MMSETIKECISRMTLEEKAGLLSGLDCWNSKALPDQGVESLRMCDGPSGLRFQTEEDDHVGVHASAEMVSFPTGCAMASSFDRELVEQIGVALGEESHSVGVNLVLGPAANIKRTPLCGRNFEYFSEDPYISGQIAAALIRGIQSQDVGACMKHFACNNQETWRMKIDARMDERALREIYLAGFEQAVKEADPCALMSSYNGINGQSACENKTLLTDILREEWEFEGFVVSDWGAMNDRVKGVKAGLDLEMPGCSGITDRQLVSAVKSGCLEESVIDRAVERILGRVKKYAAKASGVDFDREGHHELAVKAAAESAVLLKNEGGILPLADGDPVAFIGRFAQEPRFQGGGSASVTPFRLTNALDHVMGNKNIAYAPGFTEIDDTVNRSWEAEAVEIAARAKTAVIFAGLPASMESECYDRVDLELPSCQNRLIEKICEVQKHVVVVLYSGSPVTMPWLHKVQAVLQMHTGGQGVGAATAELLYGEKNPCGKLSESYPVRLEDTPSYLFYPGDGVRVSYDEGIFVGYRYYDKKKIEVLFPFGHGLSYTEFSYGNLQVKGLEDSDETAIQVSVDVTNTGSVFGREVVQLYVEDHTGDREESLVVDATAQVKIVEHKGGPSRPVRELKGFEKLSLSPGETKTAVFILNRRSFAWYNTAGRTWSVSGGSYRIAIGASSRDIRLAQTITLRGDQKLEADIAMGSLMSEIAADSQLWQFTLDYLSEVNAKLDSIIHGTDENNAYLREELKELPFYAVRGIYSVSQEDLERLIGILNDRRRGA